MASNFFESAICLAISGSSKLPGTHATSTSAEISTPCLSSASKAPLRSGPVTMSLKLATTQANRRPSPLRDPLRPAGRSNEQTGLDRRQRSLWHDITTCFFSFTQVSTRSFSLIAVSYYYENSLFILCIYEKEEERGKGSLVFFIFYFTTSSLCIYSYKRIKVHRAEIKKLPGISPA